METDQSKNKSATTSKAIETGAEIKQARRKVLRNTLIGGAVISSAAVPEKWRKPALEAVMLPAHAATTDDTGSAPGDVTTAAPTTAAPTTATPTTSAPTTPAPTTTRNPNSNLTMQFDFSSWTDPVA